MSIERYRLHPDLELFYIPDFLGHAEEQSILANVCLLHHERWRDGIVDGILDKCTGESLDPIEESQTTSSSISAREWDNTIDIVLAATSHGLCLFQIDRIGTLC